MSLSLCVSVLAEDIPVATTLATHSLPAARVRKMILSFTGHFDPRTVGPSPYILRFCHKLEMSGEKENLRRTFLTFRQRIEFLRQDICSIYPSAGHLKILPDMSGETGGLRVLCGGSQTASPL